MALRDDLLDRARTLYALPLLELLYQAHAVHRDHHDPGDIQRCTLLSVKTGGCPEDCGYCPQSARYPTGLEKEDLLPLQRVAEAARAARAGGAQRLCMGAAWREVKDGEEFEAVLSMVRGVRALGMEACCTLGMLGDQQARRLKEAGLTAYNHNLDTGAEYYGEVISTRTYSDRLSTLERVRRAGITVCSGGIIGMGERVEDRMALLATLASFDPHPESVPLNGLVRAPGTPLEKLPPVSGIIMARMVATARIAMPRAMVRLSAGRIEMSSEAQALCFVAGANSIFVGEKLLTTPNPLEDQDRALLSDLGMEPMAAAPR
jgi:biotin synthase